jgi:hypothetical protein
VSVVEVKGGVEASTPDELNVEGASPFVDSAGFVEND